MLDLKNCIAISVVLTTAMYVKPELKPAKNAEKVFSKPFSTWTRKASAKSFVHEVWPCSRFEPQKAREKCFAVNQAWACDPIEN